MSKILLSTFYRLLTTWFLLESHLEIFRIRAFCMLLSSPSCAHSPNLLLRLTLHFLILLLIGFISIFFIECLIKWLLFLWSTRIRQSSIVNSFIKVEKVSLLVVGNFIRSPGFPDPIRKSLAVVGRVPYLWLCLANLTVQIWNHLQVCFTAYRSIHPSRRHTLPSCFVLCLIPFLVDFDS